MWISVPVAERLASSAVGLVQLAHEAGECILYHEGSIALFPNDFGEDPFNDAVADSDDNYVSSDGKH